MKLTVTAWITAVVVSAITAVAPAAITVYEFFDYGTNATTFINGNGGFGFDNAWSINGGNENVTAGYEPTSMVNSAYTFMPVGGCAKNDNNTYLSQRRLATPIDLALDGDYYFSFMLATYETNIFNHLELIDGDDTTTILVGFRNDPNSPANNGKVLARVVCGTGSQGLSTQPYELSNAYYFVGKIEARAAASDFIRLNVYAEGDSVPTNAPATYQVNTLGLSLNTAISDLGLKHSITSNDGRPLKLDELRFGASWQDVVMPAMAVAPQVLELGELQPGEAATGVLAVVHNAAGVVSGSVTGVSAPFSVLSGSPYGMAGGETADVAVVFAPAGEGAYTNEVSVTGEGCFSGTAVLIGTGLPEPGTLALAGMLLLAAGLARIGRA